MSVVVIVAWLFAVISQLCSRTQTWYAAWVDTIFCRFYTTNDCELEQSAGSLQKTEREKRKFATLKSGLISRLTILFPPSLPPGGPHLDSVSGNFRQHWTVKDLYHWHLRAYVIWFPRLIICWANTSSVTGEVTESPNESTKIELANKRPLESNAVINCFLQSLKVQRWPESNFFTARNLSADQRLELLFLTAVQWRRWDPIWSPVRLSF